MTDIRTRLADALHGQAATFDECSDFYLRGWAQRSADVLLSSPSIAIVDRIEYGLLMDVARMYVNAFAEDETMTLPDRLALQRVEGIVAAANTAEEKDD